MSKKEVLEMTTAQYADMRGINRRHVYSYASQNKPLVGVHSVKKVGRFFILSVEKEYVDNFDEIVDKKK